MKRVHTVQPGFTDQVSLETKDINTLSDIGNLRIDDRLPPSQRLSQYVKQVGDPYCFRSGGVKVRAAYSPEGKSLDETLKSFLVGLKGC